MTASMVAHWFFNLCWLGCRCECGDPKARKLGHPFSDPGPSLDLEEEELALELVVASSATLLTLGARVCVIGREGEGWNGHGGGGWSA